MCQDISIGLRGATSLDSFLKAYKSSETKKSLSLTSGLTVRTSSRSKIYLHVKPLSVNGDTTMPMIKTLRIIRTQDQVNLMNNKHWRYFKLRLYQHLDGIITNIYRRLGRNTEWLHFKFFLQWYNNNKDVVLTLGAMQNCSVLSSEKFDISKLGCTLPNSANICPQKWTKKNYTQFAKAIKISARKLERLWWMDHQFVYAKSCCGQNLYKGFAKYLQIKRWSWCEPAWPLFNVSRYFNRIAWSNMFRLLS